jgi:hypothetical protein
MLGHNHKNVGYICPKLHATKSPSFPLYKGGGFSGSLGEGRVSSAVRPELGPYASSGCRPRSSGARMWPAWLLSRFFLRSGKSSRRARVGPVQGGRGLSQRSVLAVREHAKAEAQRRNGSGMARPIKGGGGCLNKNHRRFEAAGDPLGPNLAAATKERQVVGAARLSFRRGRQKRKRPKGALQPQ